MKWRTLALVTEKMDAGADNGQGGRRRKQLSERAPTWVKAKHGQDRAKLGKRATSLHSPSCDRTKNNKRNFTNKYSMPAQRLSSMRDLFLCCSVKLMALILLKLASALDAN